MLTDWLVPTFVANPDDHSNARARSAFGALEGGASVAVNLVVFAVELVPGLIIGSDETPFVIFDLEVESDDAGAVVSRVRDAVATRLPSAAKVGINVEPKYVY